MNIGKFNYKGRVKNQNPYPTCTKYAWSHMLTHMFYNELGVLKEFDAETLGELHEEGNDTNIQKQIFEQGITEESKNNAYLYRMNISFDEIGITNKLDNFLDALENDYVMAGVQDLDPASPSGGHAMLCLGIKNYNPPLTMCDIHFVNSWGGDGRKVFKNVDINGFLAKHNFYRVNFKEPYQRLTVEVGSDKMVYNFKEIECKYAKPILVEGSMYLPLREVEEILGNTVVWHGDDKIQGNIDGSPLDGKYDKNKATIMINPKEIRR